MLRRPLLGRSTTVRLARHFVLLHANKLTLPNETLMQISTTSHRIQINNANTLNHCMFFEAGRFTCATTQHLPSAETSGYMQRSNANYKREVYIQRIPLMPSKQYIVYAIQTILSPAMP